MKVLITGGTGFVGRALASRLSAEGFHVRATSRYRDDLLHEIVAVGEMDEKTNWKGAIGGAEAVIHLADRADTAQSGIPQKNVAATLCLARQAASVGVKRFIFLSSIQALSDTTPPGLALKPEDRSQPGNSYGESKRAAEMALQSFSKESGMELVIIRPPLVYGPGVKANFRVLLWAVARGVPIPLDDLDLNRRSFVSLSNLNDLILQCLNKPAAANQTFHVSDDDDISTAELLRRMGKALGKPMRNLPLPLRFVKAGLILAGKGCWVQKLYGNLRMDISQTKKLIGWKPVTTMDDELEKSSLWWKSHSKY